jgi:hypothetical protein
MSFSNNRKQLSADGKWRVPDGLQALCTVSSKYKADSSVVQGTQSYQNSLLADVSLDGVAKGGQWSASFSASTSYKNVEKGTTNYKTSYTESSRQLTLSSVDRLVRSIHRHAKSGKRSSLPTDDQQHNGVL